MPGFSILIVEDEPDIRELVSFALVRAGFTVTEAETAEEAMRAIDAGLPNAVVIDWMLPGGSSGIDLARALRRDDLTKELPLLMLTARGEEADKLRSFEVGIDDYLTKPFSPKELVARLKALLRRTGVAEGGTLTRGNLVIDLLAHRLLIGGEQIEISPTEFRLLEFLLRHPGRAFERGQLLDRVWGRGAYLEERTVDVHVLRLRKVLKSHGMDDLIQTVRGVGYRLAQ